MQAEAPEASGSPVSCKRSAPIRRGPNIYLLAAHPPGNNRPSMVEKQSPGLGALLGDPAHAQDALQAVLDTAPNVILLVEDDGRIRGANEALHRFFEIRPHEAIGMELDELLDRISSYTDDEALFRDIVARIRASAKLSESLPFNLPDYTFRVMRPAEAYLHVSGGLIKNQSGASIGQIWTLADISELHLANREIQRAQSQLVQSEKMASLGMLVAGIAHEINTSIGAISSMHDTLVKAIEKLK